MPCDDGSDVFTSRRTPEATEGRLGSRTVPPGAPSGEWGPADISILDFWLSEGKTVHFRFFFSINENLLIEA